MINPDFGQYYAAALLIAHGINPYDQFAMQSIQYELFEFAKPSLLWATPLIFPWIFWIPWVAVPFGIEVAQLVWLLVSVVFFVSGASLVVGRLNLSIRNWRVLASLLLCYPLALSIYYGQISPVIFLGFAAYIALRSRSLFWSGSALSLTLIKPHLLILIYLHELLLATSSRRFGLVCGLAFGFLLQVGLALLIAPETISWYLQAAQSFPIEFRTPSLGSLLQELSGLHSIYLRLLPVLIGCALYLSFRLSRQQSLIKDGALQLLPFSLLVSPYGWTFDHLLLVTTGLWIISTKNMQALALIFLANLLLFVPAGSKSLDQLIWFPAVYCVAVILAKPIKA